MYAVVLDRRIMMRARLRYRQHSAALRHQGHCEQSSYMAMPSCHLFILVEVSEIRNRGPTIGLALALAKYASVVD